MFPPEPDEEIELTVDEASRLAQAIQEADEGDFIEEEPERFLDELDRRLLRSPSREYRKPSRGLE